MNYQPLNWPYTPVGSPAARALLNFISAHGGGGVSSDLNYEAYAAYTEFTVKQIQAGFALLAAQGLARLENGEVLLLTPGILRWEAEKKAEAEARAAERAAKRAVKVALRGGQEKRAKIPEDVRAAVYVRDGGVCQECGTDKNLSMDHIKPWSLGGPDTVENLRVLCRPCNSRKGAKA